ALQLCNPSNLSNLSHLLNLSNPRTHRPPPDTCVQSCTLENEKSCRAAYLGVALISHSCGSNPYRHASELFEDRRPQPASHEAIFPDQHRRPGIGGQLLPFTGPVCQGRTVLRSSSRTPERSLPHWYRVPRRHRI